jgi:peptidoglycan/xylan/chitin deacetylase (PgdA/CDA1 family)
MNAKIALRNSVARLLYLSGLSVPRRRNRGFLSIVTFHRILPESLRRQYPYPGLVVTPQELDALLFYFCRHFDCGTLAAQHDRYIAGEIMSKPLLAITFDDAQADNYLHARPLLASHGLSASFFAPIEAISNRDLLWHDRLGFALLALCNNGTEGKRRLAEILGDFDALGPDPRHIISNIAQELKKMPLDRRLCLIEELVVATSSPPEYAKLMTFSDLAKLASEGHEIGSHSMSHCLMPECDDDKLRYELTESKRILESQIGHAVESFCYPNGNSDTRTAHAVSEAGYRRAITTSPGRNSLETDRFRLSRYDMDISRLVGADGLLSSPLIALRMSGLNPMLRG